MASTVNSGASAPAKQPVVGGESGRREKKAWTEFAPISVTAEDALSLEVNKALWEKMYKALGLTTASEDQRKAVRAGVYVYGAKNGTSREGTYGGEITTADGRTFSSAEIVKAVGKGRIRKFFRSNMTESYEFFKESRVMESDDRFVAKAAGFGIVPEAAFAMADWFTNCPHFSPGEVRAHDTVFAKSLMRARGARGGKTLEDVEDQRIDAEIEAGSTSKDVEW